MKMVDPIKSNQKPRLGIGNEITEFLQNEQVATPQKLVCCFPNNKSYHPQLACPAVSQFRGSMVNLLYR